MGECQECEESPCECIKPGTLVKYGGLKMTLLEHDGETAVCQWKFQGKLKADMFRLKDLDIRK